MSSPGPLPEAYASFLIRLWRNPDPAALATAGAWQAEIEHIQANRTWRFGTLDEALAFLRRQVGRLDQTDEEDSDETIPSDT